MFKKKTNKDTSAPPVALPKKKTVAVKKQSKEVIGFYLKEPYVPFLICAIIALILNAFVPFSLLPGLMSLYGGIAILCGGGFIFYWASKHIRLNGEDWNPLKIESQILIVFGPYHYSRNPLFVAAILFYMALFVFLNNIWGFVMLLPLVKLLTKYAIMPREEAFLEEYGETYQDYFEKTPRWF